MEVTFKILVIMVEKEAQFAIVHVIKNDKHAYHATIVLYEQDILQEVMVETIKIMKTAQLSDTEKKN